MANNEKSATEKMRQKFADKALDTERMEDVAGGTKREVDRDAMFLEMLLGNDTAIRILDRLADWFAINGEAIYGTRPLGNGTVQRDFFSPNNSTFSLEKAWSQVGVECKASNKSNVPNRYFINGTEVQQVEAEYYARYFAQHGEAPPHFRPGTF